MTTECMREELISEYPGELWRNRVMEMSDHQVLREYKSIQERKEKRKKIRPPYGEQMSLLSDRGRLLFK